MSLYASERQLCRALINAIATHPLIKEPGIYYPAIVGENPQTEPIRVSNWRLFGGLELIEPGLTLSVFPYHSGYKLKSGVYSRLLADKSLHFDEKHAASQLGSVSKAAAAATMRVIVQLYFQDTTFNAPIQIRSDLVTQSDLTTNIPHGDLVQITDEPQETLLDDQVYFQTEQSVLNVQILPGEEILRDYMPLLRYVVRDIPVLHPFYHRNPNILYVDYPTSNWIREGENLVFHTAYMCIEYDIQEPGINNPHVGALPNNPYKFPAPQVILVQEDK
jgi:hypothetical protein